MIVMKAFKQVIERSIVGVYATACHMAAEVVKEWEFLTCLMRSIDLSFFPFFICYRLLNGDVWGEGREAEGSGPGGCWNPFFTGHIND